MNNQSSQTKNEETKRIWQQQVEHECIHRHAPQNCAYGYPDEALVSTQPTPESSYDLYLAN